MVCEEGSHFTRPPSKKAPKEGGILPHRPSFGVGRESPGPREERVIYRAGGFPAHFTAMAEE